MRIQFPSAVYANVSSLGDAEALKPIYWLEKRANGKAFTGIALTARYYAFVEDEAYEGFDVEAPLVSVQLGKITLPEPEALSVPIRNDAHAWAAAELLHSTNEFLYSPFCFSENTKSAFTVAPSWEITLSHPIERAGIVIGDDIFCGLFNKFDRIFVGNKELSLLDGKETFVYTDHFRVTLFEGHPALIAS